MKQHFHGWYVVHRVASSLVFILSFHHLKREREGEGGRERGEEG
jgi:hypothetical protein